MPFDEEQWALQRFPAGTGQAVLVVLSAQGHYDQACDRRLPVAQG
jgi:hypothetical protein